MNPITHLTSFIGKIKEDIRNFDKRNISEEKVLSSNFFSFYKGTPVFRTGLSRSGALGAIFLSRKVKNSADAADTLRHEYGHIIQMKSMNVFSYMKNIFIPSWLELGEDSYYDRPWEITADILGGVTARSHNKEKVSEGFEYLHKFVKDGSLRRNS